ncbi:Ig-like domain-containing protein [Clostridium felsineum]|uniref:Ig-like domain-containing protein n=1 Tax=Clostridium felsineum TaxID=36839 RepID=UPI00214D2879|nr:Ig-like domain-containing protein [Clostridium felsineum]MCR3759007.1 Ig-like domain-containing protein [Clostridium felsineum]
MNKSTTSTVNTGDKKIVTASCGNIVTEVGIAPVLPQKIKALYSDGIYYDTTVNWDAVSMNSYSKSGSFEVLGHIDGISTHIKTEVMVVSGTAENLALKAASSVVEIQVMNKDGAWVSVNNVQGLGVELNKYNHTSFDPVVTKGIRMIMTPKVLGCGVIEWKVNGYNIN